MSRKLKIALVADWLTDFGGAERVLLVLHEMYPDAPIYTTLYRPENLPQFTKADVRTSYLQSVPGAAKKHRYFLPFMPTAIESFDLDEYDVVISSTSSGCAKGVITKPGTLHICYCHNPSRALWDESHAYQRLHRFGWIARQLIPRQLKKMRIWDRVASDRVDTFVTNSQFVARRIEKYYQAEAEVIYPPVETRKYQIQSAVADPADPAKIEKKDKPGSYFLAVGRLIPYKRFDLAIQAANVLGVKLRIVGTGPEETRLKSIAGPTVSFFGAVSEEILRKMYAECRALIFPQTEDFGLTAVETMAAGRPVIAFRSGGALETVVPNRTGLFFAEQTVSSLADAMQKIQKIRWIKKSIQKHAERFDSAKFKKKMDELVQTRYAEWRKVMG